MEKKLCLSIGAITQKLFDEGKYFKGIDPIAEEGIQ